MNQIDKTLQLLKDSNDRITRRRKQHEIDMFNMSIRYEIQKSKFSKWVGYSFVVGIPSLIYIMNSAVKSEDYTLFQKYSVVFLVLSYSITCVRIFFYSCRLSSEQENKAMLMALGSNDEE